MRQLDLFGDEVSPVSIAVAPSRREALGFDSASDADLAVLSDQKRQVLSVLRGGWIRSIDLIRLTGFGQADRRLRELRSDGWEILKRGSGRDVEYHWNGRVRRDY